MDAIVQTLARELGQREDYVDHVVQLLEEGNTIPFIARYRKELHGAMDDTTLRNLETRLKYLQNLQARREEVLRSVETLGKLTPELQRAVESAGTLAEVEDLYRPYRPKRRTRATVAREKGLEPLAAELNRQDGRDPAVLAAAYCNAELGVETVEEALAGASDILAEEISDDAAIRQALRQLMAKRAVLTSRAADPEKDSVYRLYYAFSSPVARLQDHQILALNRGEKEGFLKISLALPGAEGQALVCRHALKPGRTVLSVCQGGGRGRLYPADRPGGGARAARQPHGPGFGRSYPKLFPEFKAPAAPAPGAGCGHNGLGSRVPERMQGGGGGSHGAGFGHSGGIPHVFPAKGTGGAKDAFGFDPPVCGQAHRHWQRYGLPGDGKDDGGNAAPGPGGQLCRCERGRSLGLLRFSFGGGGVPHV